MPPRSRPGRSNPDNAVNFRVRVAYEPQEARDWTGRGIVIDLFRFSNTVCALLKSGRRDIRVYSGPAHAAAVKALEKGSDLFSEIEFPAEVEKYDNSPYTALRASDASRPALIVTNSGSPAVMSLVRAGEILIGCFANMPFAAEYCRMNPMDTLIVPACLYYDRRHVEDFICARVLADAIEGRDSFEAALEEIHGSGRVLDFMAFRPETGERDMAIILEKGSMAVLPRVTLSGVHGIIENIAGR
ncbi:MAG: 2-phosphosulfolactate phosphatase [Elusimicrobiales bacterium]|jgi:phosphosulfolactate phosphohydrolase-like enzyme